MEGTLAREWQLEGHQLGYHLPGGRIVGKEATFPGGVDAAEMGVGRAVRAWGGSGWISLPVPGLHHLLMT